MPRRKKTDDPIGVGLTAKQMRRKKPINSDMLVGIEPLTDNQKILFDDYAAGKNLFSKLLNFLGIDISYVSGVPGEVSL